jgi:hypothetical protein
MNYTKLYKYIERFVKLGISLTAFYFIYHQFYNKSAIIDLNIVPAYTFKNLFLLMLCLALMPINWGIDAIKWKMLLKPITNISLRKSIIATFSGVATSLFMPFRSGEFFGKILFLNPKQRWEGSAASLFSSLNQLLITIFIGSFGVTYVYLNKVSIYVLPRNLSLILIIVGIILLVFFLLFQKKIFQFVTRYSIVTEKINKEVFQSFSEQTYKILILSLVRYLVFTIQYLLLFSLFIGQVSWLDTIMLITVLFYLSSAIPSFGWAEIAVKGSLALILFEYLNNDSGVLLIAVCIWTINIGIPALIGASALLKNSMNAN